MVQKPLDYRKVDAQACHPAGDRSANVMNNPCRDWLTAIPLGYERVEPRLGARERQRRFFRLEDETGPGKPRQAADNLESLRRERRNMLAGSSTLPPEASTVLF